MRVLIVEDVPEMLELLKTLFGGLDEVRVVRGAQNVWEARQELSRHRPDLVLLDEVLPGQSSSELLLEASEEGIPVLLITELEEPTHGMPKPALGRLPKPNFKDWDKVKGLYLDYFNKIKEKQ